MRGVYRFSIVIALMFTMISLVSCKSEAPVLEEDRIYTYAAEPSDEDNFSYAEFSAWFPENIKTYRGILYLGAGYEESSLSMMGQQKWKDIARENEFIILTSHMLSRREEGTDVSYWQAEHGSGQAMLDALAHFAKESKHPEIEHAPLAMWGFSAGGQFNYHFACWKPERVITYVAVKGGYYLSEPDDKTLKVPALWFTGEEDLQRRIDAVNEMFNKNIKNEPLWCAANEPASGHEIGKTDELTIPWLEEVIKQRLPEKLNSSKKPVVLKDIDRSSGWLGDRTDGYIAPASDYNKDKNNSSWIPDESLAKIWKGFHLSQ